MAKVSAPSLEITFSGLKFRSPIGVGAVGRPFGKNITPELHAEVLLKHVDAGAAYIEIPACIYATEETIRKVQEHAKPSQKPSFHSYGARSIKARTTGSRYGVEGIYMLVTPHWTDVEWGKERGQHNEEVTKIVKERKPEDVRIIANLLGYGDLPDSFVDGAKRWEQLGADLIELNLSCPAQPAMRNAVEDFLEKRFPARWQGSVIGELPDIAENITREVVKAVNIPVGVKLSPETGFLRVVDLVRRIRDAGAKWIQTVNCGITVAPPDIYNRGKPIWPFTDGNPFVGTAGSWLRRDSYKHVAAITRFVPGIDIAAAGGLVTPEHCVEVMMLGARQVQLCTGIMEQGRRLIRQSDSFLKKFMVEQGYHSVEEIVGLGQQYMKYLEEVDISAEKVIAVLDETKCTNCGICADQYCIAIYRKDGEVKIDEENCAGCGGCIIGCPVDAIKLERKDSQIL